MLSLLNANGSRNRVLAVRCAMIILLCGGLLMLSALPQIKVRAQSQPSTGKFRRVAKPIPNQYIVVLNDNIPGSEVASRATEMAFSAGGSIGHIYRYALSGFSAKMSEAAAIALSLDARVEFVEEDGEVFPGTTQSNPPSWGLDRIDQRDLPPDNSYSYTKDGTGVNVYVIDTGIRLTHQDFGGRAHFGADCTVVDGNGNCAGTGTGDQCDHGTLVASIVGGGNQASYGVAKNVNLYSVRVLNCSSSDFSTTMAGVDWVTNNHIKPAVVNMSIFGPFISTAFDKSIRRSIAAGVTYVVIAGNHSPPIDAGTISPSDVTQAIVVGSTGDDAAPYYSDNRSSFSNYGSVLDLFAPGAGITGASSTGDTATKTDFGTSFASPHVAGAVAQYLQIDPTACPCMVNHILTDSPAQGGVVTTDHVSNPGSGSPNKLLFVPQTWPTPSYFSLSLNGSTGYIDVPDPTSGGVPLDITGSVTVEGWVKTTSTARQGIVERYNNSACTGTADGGYALLIRANGNVRFETLKNGCEFDNLDAVATVRDGNWHHIAGVWDGSQMRVYVDGQLKASKSTTFAPGTGTSHLLIGRSQDGSGFFNGLIDEVRVTAAAVYSGSSFTTQHRVTGVVLTRGLWKFDLSSDLGRDCAQVNNGSIVGGATSSTDVP
jgi:subtilisin family serine protease